MTPDAAWNASNGYELPDGSAVKLCYLATSIADAIGMQFRRRQVDQMEYQGHLIDAAVTLWLGKLHADGGRDALLGAMRIANADPENAQATAMEWWERWFGENNWAPHGEEHYHAIATAQSMWADILGAVTQPMTEEGGDNGDAESSLGKSSQTAPCASTT